MRRGTTFSSDSRGTSEKVDLPKLRHLLREGLLMIDRKVRSDTEAAREGRGKEAADQRSYHTTITPMNQPLFVQLRETLDYRDLVALLVRRNFSVLYKQTVLGPLWAIIQPLFTTVVFSVVFGGLAGLPATDVLGIEVPGFMFYLSGSLVWGYVSSTVQATSDTFRANQATMGKVYYPRLAAPVSSALSNLIPLLIQLAMLVLIWVIYAARGGSGDVALTPAVLALPLVLLQMVVLSVGVGITVSAVTTKYRDLALALGFVLQLWQYASPIAYGLSLVPREWMSLYLLNPVAPMAATFRRCLFGVGWFDWGACGLSWAVTIVVFLIGAALFGRVERTFMDTV